LWGFHRLKSKIISLKGRVLRKIFDVLFDIQKVVNVIETIGHIVLFVGIDVKSFCGSSAVDGDFLVR
jgi:hypothetical protein